MYKDIGLCLTLKHSDYLAADKSNKKGEAKNLLDANLQSR